MHWLYSEAAARQIPYKIPRKIYLQSRQIPKNYGKPSLLDLKLEEANKQRGGGEYFLRHLPSEVNLANVSVIWPRIAPVPVPP